MNEACSSHCQLWDLFSRLVLDIAALSQAFLESSYPPARKSLEAETPTPPASSKRGQPHSSADQLGSKPQLISVILDMTVHLPFHRGTWGSDKNIFSDQEQQ